MNQHSTVTPNNTTVTATSNTTTITLSTIPSFGAVDATAVSLGTMTGTLQGTANVELALQKLADQHFKGTDVPTVGTNKFRRRRFLLRH